MQPGPAAAPTRRILCVITSQDICELISVLLPDYKVASARTIAEAKLWLDKGEIDLVIAGDSVFDGTTLELCTCVREHSSAVPVIVLAGRSGPRRGEVAKCGGSAVVSFDSASWTHDLGLAVQATI